MLEKSRTELETASDVERNAAEFVARGYLAAELQQDLIPSDEAHRIVAQHREQRDETWLRAVHAALLGLRLAEAEGYRLHKAEHA